MDVKPRHRWFAFRLRTLFVVVALLSVQLGWVAYCRNWIRERREALEQRQVLEPGSSYWFPIPTTGTLIPLGPPVKYTNECRAPGGLWLFGEVGRKELMCSNASNVRQYQRLFPEARVIDDRIFYRDFPDR